MDLSRYFVGEEFDWLRDRVEAMSWKPTTRVGPLAKRRPAPVKTPIPPPMPASPPIPSPVVPAAAPAQMTVREYNAWRDRDRQARKLPYIHQEYPKMLYHTGGRRVTVNNAHEHQRHLDRGWKEAPLPEGS